MLLEDSKWWTVRYKNGKTPFMSAPTCLSCFYVFIFVISSTLLPHCPSLLCMVYQVQMKCMPLNLPAFPLETGHTLSLMKRKTKGFVLFLVTLLTYSMWLSCLEKKKYLLFVKRQFKLEPVAENKSASFITHIFRSIVKKESTKCQGRKAWKVVHAARLKYSSLL